VAIIFVHFWLTVDAQNESSVQAANGTMATTLTHYRLNFQN
jgi:hypothetical protein